MPPMRTGRFGTPRWLLTKKPAFEMGAPTMVGVARPSTSTTLTPMLNAMWCPLALGDGCAARLLTNNDLDRFDRLDRIEVDLEPEVAEIDFGRGIVLGITLDAEDLGWRIGAERPLAP